MKKRVPFIRQHEDNDCGAACLSMILQYHGKKIPLAAAAEAIQVDQHGANLYGLIDGAAKFDLTANAMEGSGEDLFRAVRDGQVTLPVIARIVNRHGLEHYIVVTSIRGGSVHYCDPGEGRKKLPCREFAQYFLGQIVTFEKNKGFAKENRRKGSVMEFLRLITRQKGLVATVGFLSLLVSGVSLMGTFLFQFLIDSVLPEISAGHGHDHVHTAGEPGGIEMFAVLITAVGVLYGIRFLVQLLRGRLLAFMTKRINLPLMLGYYDKVMDLKMEFFGSHKTGDIISRFNDAGKVQEALSNVTLTLMIDVVMVVFCGFVLYRQSAPLFSVVASILGLYVLISALFIRPLDRRSRELMMHSGRLNTCLTESIGGVQTVKACGAGQEVKKQTRQLFETLQTHGIKSAMLSMSKDALIELMTSVGTLCLLWVGAVSIASETMTLGTLMTFYTLLGYFLSPIQNVMELQSTLQSAVVAAGRLRDILDRSSEQDRAAQPFENGDIALENVAFRYGNRALVLDNLNLTIRKGEHVALVGPSGCGKTTVTKLLMGFYGPESGTVSIGGRDIRAVDLTELRENVAYVPQETFLFSGTVRSNLLLGNPRQLADDQIGTVLDSLGCDFIHTLPFGLDTVLDENGSNLSGGQRQRLAIARALLRNPKILILDEATSNLDAFSEAKLQEALQQLDPDMTVIMVAHRLGSIRSCHRVIVLEQGQAVQQGSFHQLLSNDGAFARLWEQMNGPVRPCVPT